MIKIREFPESLYEPWCKLCKRFTVDHQTSLVNLLQRSRHAVIQSALLDTHQHLEDFAPKLSRLTEIPSESQLLSGYACLKELENLYGSDPWRHRRAGKVPEVQIENQRYILWSPPYGHIAAAVPVAQRFTPDRLIGRNRAIGLRYCWIPIPAEMTLDVDRTPAMIIVSATAWWAVPTLQTQAVDFLTFVGWALPTTPYGMAACGPNDDQGHTLRSHENATRLFWM